MLNIGSTRSQVGLGAKASTAAGRSSRAEEKKDMAALSQQATDYQSVKKALENVPDLRTEKITELSDKLDSGQYSVKTKDIADKILGNKDKK